MSLFYNVDTFVYILIIQRVINQRMYLFRYDILTLHLKKLQLPFET